MKLLSLAAAGIVLLASCNSADNSTAVTKDTAIATATADTGWIALFDGKTTTGWHTYGQATAGQAWKVADGMLYLDTTQKEGWQIKGGGDLLTNEAFENFHFETEWKIAPGGNSGIIFLIKDDTAKYDYIWKTGPEMQVLDNAGHADAKIIKHKAGDLYDLIESSTPSANPAGEWNKAEIIVNKGKLDLLLNGTNIVSTTMWDDNWKKLIAGSKFKDMPDFGTIRSGNIALQDHGNAVWYRNIRIKKL
jgi:hypothetical protein